MGGPRPPFPPVDEDEAAGLQHVDDGVRHGAVAVRTCACVCKGMRSHGSPQPPYNYAPDAAHGGVEREHRLRELGHDGDEVLALLQVQGHELDLLLHQAHAHAGARPRRQRAVPVSDVVGMGWRRGMRPVQTVRTYSLSSSADSRSQSRGLQVGTIRSVSRPVQTPEAADPKRTGRGRGRRCSSRRTSFPPPAASRSGIQSATRAGPVVRDQKMGQKQGRGRPSLPLINCPAAHLADEGKGQIAQPADLSRCRGKVSLLLREPVMSWYQAA